MININGKQTYSLQNTYSYRALFKFEILLIAIFIIPNAYATYQCTSVKYPVGLKGSASEVKYTSLDINTDGDFVIAGSTKSTSLFDVGDSLGASSLGFPIFQFYDVSDCEFVWSKYIYLNLASPNVVSTFRTDNT